MRPIHPKSAKVTVVLLLAIVSIASSAAQAVKHERGKHKKNQPTETITINSEEEASLLLDRISHFLKTLAPSMAPVGKGKTFHVEGHSEKTLIIKLKPPLCYRFAAASTRGAKITALSIKPTVGKPINGRNLDEFIFADICPEKSGKVKIKVTADGNGTAGIASFVGSPDCAVLYGKGQHFDLEILLGRIQQMKSLYGTGMKPTQTVSVDILKQGEEKTIPLELKSGFCYRFLVATSCTKSCYTEIAYKSSKGIIGKNMEKGNKVILDICPENSTKGNLIVKFSSAGRAKEAISILPLFKRKKTRLKIFPPGNNEKDYIASTIVAVFKEKIPDHKAVSPLLRTSLKTNEAKEFPIKLQGGICYSVISAGAPSVKDIKVEFINPIGQEIAREMEKSPVALIKTTSCPKWDGTYKIRIRMFQGYGNVGAQIFGKM